MKFKTEGATCQGCAKSIEKAIINYSTASNRVLEQP